MSYIIMQCCTIKERNMTIKIKYNRAFEIEDVVPGDVLIDRGYNEIMYVVIYISQESEEYICMRINEHGTIKSLMHRIGFELVDQYLKIEIDDTVD